MKCRVCRKPLDDDAVEVQWWHAAPPLPCSFTTELVCPGCTNKIHDQPKR